MAIGECHRAICKKDWKKNPLVKWRMSHDKALSNADPNDAKQARES
jgi:hypothetical protein